MRRGLTEQGRLVVRANLLHWWLLREKERAGQYCAAPPCFRLDSDLFFGRVVSLKDLASGSVSPATQRFPLQSEHRHFYHNPAIQAVRSVSVYTPPGYEDHPDRNWPVLFLFHGSGGTDESWFQVGHANIILDNLIAEGKAEPMIVVAPFGHTVEPGTHGWPFVQEQGDFVQDFVEVLLPYIEKRYRISDDPHERALAGYSMGGYHTVKIGLKHLDQFANLGPFSWGRGKDFFDENAPQVLTEPQKVADQIDTLFIACGRDDFLFGRVQGMCRLLSDCGIEPSVFVSDGGHEMANWRRFLYEYAQRLFEDR